ncbi:AraC family transcriptional regulator [Mariniflexile litorale]|uniref:AraC family transcriptional regulator n=1 Tax=Mariniflexile litorale TaxID=3045158 RepID=A0AAU7EGN6_9FLAO|nr:AraC family transcriptional regulator [Mariniflexile sp. KMM 9835]MDQ8211897.1 AraC family transcriptional regulator [Mariniflexile sp. KMM 9835]
MKTISITSSILSSIFEQIQIQLGGRLEIKSKEYRLEINNDIAKGFISGISVEPAISYMEYDIVFKEDVSLLYTENKSNSIHFGYCSKGQLIQSFNEYGEKNVLGQFQTGIFSNSVKESTFLAFRKNEEVKLSMVTVDVLSVSDKELKAQLQNTFLINQENNEFSYIGSFNLKISEKIEHLNAISQKGLVRNLLINSIVYLILALEIEQHKYDLVNAESYCNSLSQADMEAIKDISEFIRNYPEIQYSLKYLSKKAGLSPIKLQEGFKIMHNRTVTDFIRNVRVEVAENLIRTSELNISEIVYTVGLTSRSYFSKIFKEKYNCSPKHYQNHQNKLAVTA